MTLLIRLLPEAKAEFDAAADWYEGKRAGLGVDFVRRVHEVFARISANPRLHAKVYREVRKAIVTRFPYIVLYQEEANEVLVVSIFPTARDPSIWKSRV
jgi:toxin ParE1/3/4